jgi:6,7-dimethyl-8-ribityllumazine synthase
MSLRSTAPGCASASIVSRFNNLVTDRLLEGALDGFRRHGVGDDRIEVASVPGAFELPLAATLMAASARVDTIACLGRSSGARRRTSI